jgi:dTDP-4-dehydrorhamnose reductase
MGNEREPVILLTGAAGQAGFELRRSLAPHGTVLALDRAGCDLSRPDEIRSVLRSARPDVVVNAGAYTAVDQAESDEAAARAVNAVAPRVLAEEAAALGALLVHYSTDYVFDGCKAGAYNEDDEPAPLSVYGQSKLEGDRAVAASGCRHLVFRTSWSYGLMGKNFPKSILQAAMERSELRIVSDQFGAPTPATLLADVTGHAVSRFLRGELDSDLDGIYHLAAAGETNWYEYARRVVRAASTVLPLQCGPDAIMAVSSEEYQTPAPRPKNSRLDTAKLHAAFGVRMPDWTQGVDLMLAQLLGVAKLVRRSAAS